MAVAEDVVESAPVRLLGRVGLLAYGGVHLVVAGLVAQVALGEQERADKQQHRTRDPGPPRPPHAPSIGPHRAPRRRSWRVGRPPRGFLLGTTRGTSRASGRFRPRCSSWRTTRGPTNDRCDGAADVRRVGRARFPGAVPSGAPLRRLATR